MSISSSNPALAKPLPICKHRLLIVLAGIVLVGMALRVPGLFTDFWGDEIWSWIIAGEIHSVSGVVLSEASHIDNNHPLATLFLYLLGQHQPVWVYRLPSLLAGVAAVIEAVRLMLKRGRIEAIIAALLFSFSYPLIFYSSEARGYAFVVLFSLLSLDFLEESLRVPSQKSYGFELLFGVCCCLGFLSHLMFINTYTAALAWTLVRARQLEPTTTRRLIRVARLHLIPVVFVLLLFHFFVKDLVDGGAPPTSSLGVLLQSLSLTLGGSASGIVAILAALAVILLFVAGLIYLAAREHGGHGEHGGQSTIWVYFLFAIVIAPAMMCTRALYFNSRPQPLMLRYFLISIAMLFLCVCPLLAHGWREPSRYRPWLRLLLGLLLAIFIGGNLWNLESFIALGRGHYAQALNTIAVQTPGGETSPISITSDNPIRTELLIRFYGPRIASKRPVDVSTDPSAWLVFNRFNGNAPHLVRYREQLYRLEGIYPSGDLSGWTWWLYRRDQPSRP